MFRVERIEKEIPRLGKSVGCLKARFSLGFFEWVRKIWEALLLKDEHKSLKH